ncbi:hypothetical protein MCELANE86_00483 [Candidatus Nanopelagicaceae bacterium]
MGGFGQILLMIKVGMETTDQFAESTYIRSASTDRHSVILTN